MCSPGFPEYARKFVARKAWTASWSREGLLKVTIEAISPNKKDFLFF